MKNAFENIGVKLLGIVPRVELEGRGTIPEVEIRYEEFGAKAIETAEQSINLNELTELALPPKMKSVDYEALTEKFKKLLLTDFTSKSSASGRGENCL
jgi:hypothetical protein